jgi:predicted Rossmann-fold nucleotide-binding protein
MHFVSTNSEEVHHAREHFKKAHHVHAVVAISGGCDDTKARHFIDQLIHGLSEFPLAVQCGGTLGGVPEDVAASAHRHGVPVVGVFPERAHTRGKVVPHLDLGICVASVCGDSEHGDEAAAYARFAEALVLVNGGAGSLAEVALVAKENDILLSRRGEGAILKPIVAVGGFGGCGDLLHHPVFIASGVIKPAVRRKCMPGVALHSHEDVIAYVVYRLSLSVARQSAETA